MDDNIKQKKALPTPHMWYFHPSETVRMLRYFQFNSKLDPAIDLTPNYSDNIEVGVVINANNKPAYVELQLYYLTQLNKINSVLIYDNCSEKKEQLQQLAKKYNVDFYSTESPLLVDKQLGSLAELNCFYIGLMWANDKKLDILVKLEDKFIPCCNWINELKCLALATDATTFTSWCEKYTLPARTECIALHVKTWIHQFALYNFKFCVENEMCVYIEIWIHEIIKALSYQNNSSKWNQYIKNNNVGYMYSGYAVWQDLLGTNRENNDNKNFNVLWHEKDKTEDYLRITNKIFPNKYSIDDFK